MCKDGKDEPDFEHSDLWPFSLSHSRPPRIPQKSAPLTLRHPRSQEGFDETWMGHESELWGSCLATLWGQPRDGGSLSHLGLKAPTSYSAPGEGWGGRHGGRGLRVTSSIRFPFTCTKTR